MRGLVQLSPLKRLFALIFLLLLFGFSGVIRFYSVVIGVINIAIPFIDYNIYISDLQWGGHWIFGIALALPSLGLMFFRFKVKYELFITQFVSVGIAILMLFVPILYHQLIYSMESTKPFRYGVLAETMQFEYFGLIGSIIGTSLSILFLKRRERIRFSEKSNNELLDVD